MKAATAAIAAAAPLAAIAALAGPPTAPASGAQPDQAGAGKTITRTAHVDFENCNAQHITLSVTAPTHAFRPIQPVSVTVRLRNTGNTACGTPLAQHVPEAHHALTVGPCGALSLTVRTTKGVAVYPGDAVFHCPDLTGFELGPHATAQATAEWSQTETADVSTTERAPAKPQQAPPGTYRLTVEATVTVPVTLTTS